MGWAKPAHGIQESGALIGPFDELTRERFAADERILASAARVGDEWLANGPATLTCSQSSKWDRALAGSIMKRTTLVTVGIAAAVVLAVAAAFLSNIGRTPQGGADAGDQRQEAMGERVYREHCAACHGAKLEGQPDWQVRRPDGRMPAPPHSESGHTWHHTDEVLFRITKQGLASLLPGYQSDMPAYADVLTDEEIWAGLAFIKSTWPPTIQARQAAINRRSDQPR